MHREQQGHISLFILGMLCMFMGVGCFAFILYMAPYILLDVQYNVPDFIARVSHWYETHYDVSGAAFSMLIFLPALIAGIVFFIIARYIDRFLETHHELGMPDIPEEEIKAHEVYTDYAALSTAEVEAEEEGGVEAGIPPVPFRPIIFIVSLIVIVLLVLALGEYFVLVQFFD